MTRVADESALVLHARPYRETSAIVSLLTAAHGRVAVVARGLRGHRRGNWMQPFNRVRASWSGRGGGLATLTGCELERHAWLAGDSVASGFYVVELVSRLLPEHEAVPAIFAAACWVLERLEAGDAPEVVLRVFERRLLEELGYGLDFARDAETGADLEPGGQYVLHAGAGFVAASSAGRGFPGAVLLDIGAERYQSRAARVAARKIFRQSLSPLLGPRPLASRRLLTGKRA
ncbi:MAG: DNA repair protein RecO [Gammaproteobacteria bacterium]|nr:DNA repair protein RecO [Gammaproteobacteria bacterium]|tara:strand:+ start:2161 stop:2856 length:696 start_codon:yes stop_codon:yes gene_type:complete